MAEKENTKNPNPAGSSEKYKKPDGSQLRFDVSYLTKQKMVCEAAADWTLISRNDKPLAEVFSVYYRVESKQPRPVTFIFNGGPGASSAYLHVGALGPQRIFFEADGSIPKPPAKLTNNLESWLSFTDLVFVDPVGTGFSRKISDLKVQNPPETSEKVQAILDPEKYNDQFFGLKRDLESLGEFITKFLSDHNRWMSPVYIAGESYGGYRVAKLSRLLQETYGVGVCGAILISPALELTLLDGSDYDSLMWTDVFPSLALAAQFHQQKQKNILSALEAKRFEIEEFALKELSVALISGERLAEKDLKSVLEKVTRYLNLSKEVVDVSQGRVGMIRFVREYLRKERKVLGLYDAAQKGFDPFPDREPSHAPDPTFSGIEWIFTSGINHQLRTNLKLKTDRHYHLLNPDVFMGWRNDLKKHVFETQLGSVDDMRYALALNPHMKMWVVHGLFDLVTPYFASERLVGLMRLEAAQKAQLKTSRYLGGHMFYSWEDSRKQFYNDARKFYS